MQSILQRPFLKSHFCLMEVNADRAVNPPEITPFYRLLLRKGASPFWILAFETIQKELYNEKKDGILQVKQMLSKRCGIWRSV